MAGGLVVGDGQLDLTRGDLRREHEAALRSFWESVRDEVLAEAKALRLSTPCSPESVMDQIASWPDN